MPVLTPAYGRVYETFKEVDDAYAQGDDFIFHDPSSRWNGKYCSCRDFFGEKVELRFGKNLEHGSVVMVHKQEPKPQPECSPNNSSNRTHHPYDPEPYNDLVRQFKELREKLDEEFTKLKEERDD